MPIRTAQNSYVVRSRLTEVEFLKLLKLFVEGKSAAQIADAIRIDRNTVNAYIQSIRKRIALLCDEFYKPKELASIKTAISFVDTRRAWSERGKNRVKRFRSGMREIKKTRILVRSPRHFAIKVLDDEKVWTALIPKWDDFNYLYRAERHLSRSGTWKQWLAFDAIAGYGSEKPLRILKEENSPNVKAFWYDLKAMLKKRRGTNDKNFYYHLKEIEFRHNTQEENPTAILADEFLKNPLRLDLVEQ